MSDEKQPRKVRKLVFAETLKKGAGAEARRAPRYLVSRITACRIIRLPQPLAMEARLHDISTGGIGVYAPAWLDPGTFLVITVEGWLGANRTMRAKVVHTTEVEKGCWLLGCSLDAPLTWQEVEDLL
ncbi:hypothetical protein AYO44_02120 [Planctomycetaceae bacterium SCGC AG-212-F19]|nr:hypothetical protein AYO44_02120 [Planctomycetaceae bacterium SCGC AG-212-F19]